MLNNGNGEVTDLKSPILFFIAFILWMIMATALMLITDVSWDQFYKNLLLSFSQILSKGLPLCFLVVIFDLISPGAFLKKVAEDSYACAAVMSAFLLSYGLIIN